MSFASELEDQQTASLEEVFAFIESFSDENSGTDRNDDGQSTDSDHSQLSHGLPQTWPPQPLTSAAASAIRETSSRNNASNAQDHQSSLQKSRAANAGAVVRYHKRVTAEIRNLREQAWHLTARIAHLRNRAERANATSRSATASDHSHHQHVGASSAALDHAIAEFRKLEQSEALNRKLHHALAKQAIVKQKFVDFLQKEMGKLVRGCCRLLFICTTSGSGLRFRSTGTRNKFYETTDEPTSAAISGPVHPLGDSEHKVEADFGITEFARYHDCVHHC
ncbi:hypothetical protein FI667_g11718, partial [Globisporangium splendens]